MKIVNIGANIIILYIVLTIINVLYFYVIGYDIIKFIEEESIRTTCQQVIDVVFWIGFICYFWRVPDVYEEAVERMYKRKEV